MNRYLCLLFMLLSIVTASTGQDFIQVWRDSPNTLPEDLKTETILFLKFDSAYMPEVRPKGMDKAHHVKWRYHDSYVQKTNAELREYAKKYPYKYKIVSMADYKNYKNHGAKYLFYINSFDALTLGVTYERRDGYAPSTQLGIVDLTSDKSYVIDRNISTSLTNNYKALLSKLFKAIEKQFNARIE